MLDSKQSDGDRQEPRDANAPPSVATATEKKAISTPLVIGSTTGRPIDGKSMPGCSTPSSQANAR